MDKYQNLFRLNGKAALVTGAGRGIGEAIARSYAAMGCSVFLVSRSEGELHEVAASIEAAGGRAGYFAADISSREDRSKIIIAFLDWNPKLDILVNVAGTSKPAPALEVTEEQWDATYGLNCKATFFLTQAAAREMDKTGGGRVITIVSHLAFAAVPGKVVYSSSKAALVKMTEVLAVELAPSNINVNALAPSYTRTKLAMEVLKDEQFMKYVLDNTPISRISDPIDMCGAAIYLASDASRMVTGQTLIVDGGWTAR